MARVSALVSWKRVSSALFHFALMFSEFFPRELRALGSVQAGKVSGSYSRVELQRSRVSECRMTGVVDDQ